MAVSLAQQQQSCLAQRLPKAIAGAALISSPFSAGCWAFHRPRGCCFDAVSVIKLLCLVVCVVDICCWCGCEMLCCARNAPKVTVRSFKIWGSRSSTTSRLAEHLSSSLHGTESPPEPRNITSLHLPGPSNNSTTTITTTATTVQTTTASTTTSVCALDWSFLVSP